MKGPKSIRGLFAFAGFIAVSALKGVFGDRYARIIVLRRQKKRPFVPVAATDVAGVTTNGRSEYGTCQWPTGAFTSSSSVGEFTVLGAARCS